MPVPADKGRWSSNTTDNAVVEDEDDGGGFGAYIPGSGARVARPGQARTIRGDRFHYLRWNLHFQATGKPEISRPKIGIWWANESEVTSVERSLGLREQTSEGQALIAPIGRSRATSARART